MVLLYFLALVTIEGVIQRAIEGLTQDQEKRRVNMLFVFYQIMQKTNLFSNYLMDPYILGPTQMGY